jgi:hypothetical protein
MGRFEDLTTNLDRLKDIYRRCVNEPGKHDRNTEIVSVMALELEDPYYALMVSGIAQYTVLKDLDIQYP